MATSSKKTTTSISPAKKPAVKKVVVATPASKATSKKAAAIPVKKTIVAATKKAVPTPVKKVSTPKIETPTSKKAAPTKSAPKKIIKKTTFTPEDRYHMIATAAYFHAEQRGFAGGYEMGDWISGEAQIDAMLNAWNRHILEFSIGYGSVFGDGNFVEADFCQECIQSTLGKWLRITDDDPFDSKHKPANEPEKILQTYQFERQQETRRKQTELTNAIKEGDTLREKRIKLAEQLGVSEDQVASLAFDYMMKSTNKVIEGMAQAQNDSKPEPIA